MADRVLFLGWKRPVPGREAATTELFQQVVGYLGAQQAEERIESFEPVFLNPAGSGLSGFILIRADAPKLMELQQQEKFLELVFRADYGLEDFALLQGNIGEGITRSMELWSKIVDEGE